MIAADRGGLDLAEAGVPPEAVAEATVTVTLSLQALGALGAYLRSGAARGLPFERPLLEAVCGAAGAGGAPAGARRALSPRTVRRVQEFIEANLARDIGVADIAAAACVSPHHLGRGFRQATGQSLWQFVLARRATRARRLIEARPRTTLAEIAALCGFDSYSQFIAAFRKLHGVTPGDWRRRREAQ